MKINETQLRKMVENTVRQTLNEISPQLAAAYAGGRRGQAINPNTTQQDSEKYTQKAREAEDYATSAWNKKYGYANGDCDANETQWMDGPQNFTHNQGTKFCINYQNARFNPDTHTNTTISTTHTTREQTPNGTGTEKAAH